MFFYVMVWYCLRQITHLFEKLSYLLANHLCLPVAAQWGAAIQIERVHMRGISCY